MPRDYSHRIYGTEDERFWPKVVKHPGGCWEWQGHLLRGYGRFYLSDRKSTLPHRWAYQKLVGTIPDGYTVDHLCFNRRCVNPEHLEAITNAENVRRSAIRAAALATSCRAGLHPYPENRVLEPSTGKTRCHQCKLEASRRYQAKRKA